jgi:hypothetical protein
MPPWYTRPAALTIIRRLLDNPPERKFERSRTSRNWHDGDTDYTGYDVLALRDRFKKVYAAETVNKAGEYQREVARDLLHTDADEVLAALFGDPNNLDWAHPDRTEKRKAMAEAIHAALAVKVAA